MRLGPALALAAALLTAALAAAAANGTAANATAVNKTAANGTLYFVTPSGTVHLRYNVNGTFVVVNFNGKVLTFNIKANVTEGTTSYYIHVVGMAMGRYSNATAQEVRRLLQQAARGNLTALESLLRGIASSNETAKLRAKAMVTASRLNATQPNATHLRAMVEYELKRRLSRLNTTLTPEYELDIKANLRDLNATAALLTAIANRMKGLPGSTELLKAAELLKNASGALRELELYMNGTKVEVKVTPHGVKVEVEREGRGRGHGKDEAKEHEEDKGKGGGPEGRGEGKQDKGGGKGGGDDKKDEEERDKDRGKDKDDREKD